MDAEDAHEDLSGRAAHDEPAGPGLREKPLNRRTALVTGAASGIGLEVARSLAGQGWHVVALDLRAPPAPPAGVQYASVDLASLAAVGEFCGAWRGPLDLLVNNAGLLPRPQRVATAEGFELGFGVSVVGHFALTAGVLPALLRGSQPRVVTTSSIAHRGARIAFDDLPMARDYDPFRAYASAKLGALLFALELERRARAAGVALQSLAAHPGIARTRIGAAWDGLAPSGLRQRLAGLALGFAMRWLSQNAEQGAAPLLHAALAPDVRGGEFYGPSGAFEWRGAPKRVVPSVGARDPGTGARLWQALEGATQVRYDWGIR